MSPTFEMETLIWAISCVVVTGVECYTFEIEYSDLVDIIRNPEE